MAAGLAILMVSGCASQHAGARKGGDIESMCDPVILGLASAATCGLVVKGNNRVRAAAACAAVAVVGCYVVNSYAAQQTRTARQVEEDYARNNRPLPSKPAVVTYTSSVNPKQSVARGDKVEVGSQIVVLPGRYDKKVKVEEELAIVDSSGQQWGESVRKMANDGTSAGEYRTSFKIPVHEGMSQGVYTVKKSLYLNGAMAQAPHTARFQVVTGPLGTTVAWID